MTNGAKRGQRGSTMLEVALLAPVVAAFLAGLVGVSMTFVRTMQVDQICKKAAQLGVAGSDFDQEAVRAQVYGLYGGQMLQDRNAVLYVTHVVRDAAGYRTAKAFALGRVNRWRSSAEEPERVIELEPGEDAWITEVFFDNESILSGITPAELHARSIL